MTYHTDHEVSEGLCGAAELARKEMARPVSPCTGWLGRIFGHKFRARYSKEPPRPSEFMPFDGSVYAFKTMMHRFTTRTYHHDICERCGAIRRQEPKP